MTVQTPQQPPVCKIKETQARERPPVGGTERERWELFLLVQRQQRGS